MNKTIQTSFINSVGVLIYIVVVASIMQHGEQWFGQMKTLVGPIAFLLLFTVSAVIVSSLVIGKPVMLYLDGKKKEAVSLFMATGAWLVAYLVVIFIYLAVR